MVASSTWKPNQATIMAPGKLSHFELQLALSVPCLALCEFVVWVVEIRLRSNRSPAPKFTVRTGRGVRTVSGVRNWIFARLCSVHLCALTRASRRTTFARAANGQRTSECLNEQETVRQTGESLLSVVSQPSERSYQLRGANDSCVRASNRKDERCTTAVRARERAREMAVDSGARAERDEIARSSYSRTDCLMCA